MAYRTSRLPSRFPVGTKFVVEGSLSGDGQTQVFTRYLEFPDGTHFPLPATHMPLPARPQRKGQPAARRTRSRSRSR